MGDLVFMKMADCAGDAQREAAAVFVDGYYGELSQRHRDRGILIAALEDGE